MNVVFLSPNFPPQYYLFCAALRAEGHRALGIGEAPHDALEPALRDALDDYVHVPRMDDRDAVVAAVDELQRRHGRVEKIESLNEHWLALEAALRARFAVPGLDPETLARYRSKSGMARVFAAADVPYPPTARVESGGQVRAFAARHGLPLVCKPDVGVGAAGTFTVATEADVERLAGELPADTVMQPYVAGTITTFDGLTDRDGRVVFAVSFVYNRGVMEILHDRLDVFYYTRRVVPPALDALGRRVVAAFELRERFFHAEFFERASGDFVALEVNLRPPGGFTTDLMNYACEVDVYRLWARVLAGADLADFRYERCFHCAHVSRRAGRRYRVADADLPAALGDALVLTRAIPAPLNVAMGDVLYVVRTADLARLERAIEVVHAVATD